MSNEFLYFPEGRLTRAVPLHRVVEIRYTEGIPRRGINAIIEIELARPGEVLRPAAHNAPYTRHTLTPEGWELWTCAAIEDEHGGAECAWDRHPLVSLTQCAAVVGTTPPWFEPVAHGFEGDALADGLLVDTVRGLCWTDAIEQEVSASWSSDLRAMCMALAERAARDYAGAIAAPPPWLLEPAPVEWGQRAA